MRAFAVLVALVAGASMVAPAFAASTVDRTLSDDRITESSGLAPSARTPGVVFTHNDSGDGPRVFAVGRDGATAAVLTLRGAEARDWEAMAPGRRGSNTLWIGDIGDNLAVWPSVRVFRITEPADLRTQDVAWTKYELTYPDGAHNAESLLVHPRSGRLYVVTKEVMGGALYEAPAALRTDRPNQLRRVAKALPYATDAAFSPDGKHYVVRGYVDAAVYATAKPGAEVATIDLPAQPQGESIAWSPDGQFLYAGSEGSESDVYRVALPASVTGVDEAAAASSTPTASASEDVVLPSGTDGVDDGGGSLPRSEVLWLAAGAIVLIALGVSLRSWARRDPDEA